MWKINIGVLIPVLKKVINSKYFDRSTNPYNWSVDYLDYLTSGAGDTDGMPYDRQVAKAFGVPNDVPVWDFILKNHGTGLSGDKEFIKNNSKYSDSWKGGLYDVWNHIKSEYGNEINFDMNEGRKKVNESEDFVAKLDSILKRKNIVTLDLHNVDGTNTNLANLIYGFYNNKLHFGDKSGSGVTVPLENVSGVGDITQGNEYKFASVTIVLKNKAILYIEFQ